MLRPIHFEIHAEAPGRAQAFYEALFGWSFERWGDHPYWMIKTGEGPGLDGGLVPRRGESPPLETPTPVVSWVCTVEVPELDTYVEKALALGGAIALPKMPVAGVGWLAYCKDTEGNIFGMMCHDPKAA